MKIAYIINRGIVSYYGSTHSHLPAILAGRTDLANPEEVMFEVHKKMIESGYGYCKSCYEWEIYTEEPLPVDTGVLERYMSSDFMEQLGYREVYLVMDNDNNI